MIDDSGGLTGKSRPCRQSSRKKQQGLGGAQITLTLWTSAVGLSGRSRRIEIPVATAGDVSAEGQWAVQSWELEVQVLREVDAYVVGLHLGNS